MLARLDDFRGASRFTTWVYKTLHDARRKLRRHLDELGLSIDALLEETH